MESKLYHTGVCIRSQGESNEASFQLNPHVTNGLSHPYHFDESTFAFRGIRSDFFFHFSMKFMKANRTASDETPHFAVSHLGLFCLSMSNKNERQVYMG